MRSVSPISCIAIITFLTYGDRGDQCKIMLPAMDCAFTKTAARTTLPPGLRGSVHMNWIEVNGTGLRYELSGGGPSTLVLIHEMGGTLDSWDQGLSGLNNGRQVLRYDTRGAGLSEKINGIVTWNDMADDLKALLDALNIAKVAVAGIAVGASIGMHFAVRNPDRVTALVLHGPAPGVSADRRQQTMERAAAVEAGGMRGVVETSVANSYPPIVRHNADVFNQ